MKRPRAFADTVYGRVFFLLLYLLPPDFRRRFGGAMTEALEQSLRDSGGTFERLGIYRRAVTDLLVGVIPEWVDELRGDPARDRRAGLSGARHSRRSRFPVTSLFQDIRFAFRTLRKRPLFAALAMTTLGLGIGAPTAMFSVINAVLLRPLPYRDPGQLVEVWQVRPAWKEREGLRHMWQNLGVSYPQFEDWKRDQKTFESVAVFHSSEWSQMTLTGDGPARTVSVGVASSTLLPTLGVEPLLGRGFRAEEEARSGGQSDRVAIVTHGFWRSYFGSDPEVLGKALTLDGSTFIVVGVLPADFRLRSMSHSNDADLRGTQDVWILPGAGTLTTSRSSNLYDAIGRIRRGVTLEVAAADVQASMFQGAARTERTARLVPRRYEELAGLKSPLLMLLAATGLLLLIGCGNTAILSVSELSGRRRELATRWALGAGRSRVVRQLLTESLLLAGMGSVVGLLVAWAGTRALVAMAPPIPRLHEVGIDVRVLLFAGCLGVLTGVLFGTLPAAFSTRGRTSALSTRTPGGLDASRSRLQRVLVGMQMALTVVLLVTGGLLARSLFALRSVDPGFRAQGLATVRISIPDGMIAARRPGSAPLDDQAERARITEARATVVDALLARIRALPGVTAVSAANALPFPGDRVSSNAVTIVGRTGAASRLDPDRVRVSPGFYQTMGIPLLSGRTFAESDRGRSPAVAIISASFAQRHWPNRSPLGSAIADLDDGSPITVVGVVGDVKVGSLSESVRPTFYLPFGQSSASDLNLVARGEGKAAVLAGQMRDALHSLYPSIPVSEEGSLSAMVAWSAREDEYRALLMNVFAGVATVLAAAGIFGVTARIVTHRSREMGIRIAVGATHGRLVTDVIRASLSAGLSGIAIGLVAAFWASRLVAKFLFGVGATDPLVYGLVGVLVTGLCLFASYVPAMRVLRIDPAGIMKEE